MFKSVFKSGIRATYDVLNNPTFVSEPWYIYPARHNTTGKLASVFIFDKAKFESTIHKICASTTNTKNPKVIISECYELIKFEVSQMTKLKHPQILTIYEVLEETKLKFLFATESIVDNLQTINIDQKLDELSIQKGLLEICKSLQFLHNYCNIIHLNLQPSSIFINQQGDWKLAGFRFLQNLNEISPQERENYFIMNNTSVVPFSNLNLNFTPPELVVDSLLKLEFGNDMWSLACLIFYIYNKGEYLINCFDANSISDFKSEFRKFESKFYNHRVTELKYVLKDVPKQLYNVYPSLLARYPGDRLTIDQLIDSDYFNGSLVKAMWFVDEFSTKTVEDKLVFLKGLLEVKDGKIFLDQFPTSFKNNKLLPLLIELLKTELSLTLTKQDKQDIEKNEMVCCLYSIILKIGKNFSNLTFHDRVFEQIFLPDPKVRKKERIDYFDKLINYSVKVRLAFIQSFDILLEKLNDKDFVDLIKKSLTLILTLPSNEEHFKNEQIQTQDLFFENVHLFVQKFDFPYIKNTFFPAITQVFKTTGVLSTKLATLAVFEQIIESNIIDKLIVTEQLLPLFQGLKSRDKRIVSNTLRFFGKLSKDTHVLLDIETIIEYVLPVCFKLVFGCNDCTQSEFKIYMKTVNDIQSSLVTRKLEELPTKIPERVTSGTDSNFDSLIKTQAINTNNLESIHPGPQSKPMTPSQPTRTSTSSRNSSSYRREQPQSEMPVLQPKRLVKPLNLKESLNPHKFGSVSNTIQLNTSTKPNPVSDKLMNTLEGTFAANEFLDFQSATPISTKSSVVSTPRTVTPTMVPMIPNTTKQPPGYNGTVMTPSSAPRSYSSKPVTNGNTNDLLDLI